MKYEISKTIEKSLLWLAWRMPKRLVYNCAVRVWAHATTGVYGHINATEITLPDALKSWEETPEQANARFDVLGALK